MKTHLLLSLAFTSMIFSACAKSSSDSTTTTAGATTSATSTTNASCNAFASTDGNFGGRLATYYSGSTFVEDQMRVRITNLSSSFDAGNQSLEFFRIRGSASGYTLDSTPLTFTIYYGTTAISSAMTSISSASVKNLIASTGISNSSASSSDFFSKTTIVVSGVDNSYQILKPTLYSSGGTAVEEANALMPLFAANPTTYAANHASQLATLHPFYSMTSSGYTDAQFVALANQNCFQ